MKLSKPIKFIIKLAVILASYGFIIYKLTQYELFSTFEQFDFLSAEKLTLLIFSFLLMFLNWSFEAVKWKLLIKKLESISFFTSIKAVFSGITVSIFTPNRIGEFGGRIFVLKSENRVSGILSTIIGSISQLLITTVLGISSTGLFLYFYPEKSFLQEYNQTFIIVLLTTTALISVIIYFNLSVFSTLLSKISFLKKYNKSIEIFEKYSTKELSQVLLLSLARYVVFVSQFYLLLKFTNVDISYFEAFITISITYFMVALVPTITLAEVGVRGSIAIFFIGMFANNELGIVSASAILWLINLTIPSLIGSWVFYRMKL